jgi:hypothetical protein
MGSTSQSWGKYVSYNGEYVTVMGEYVTVIRGVCYSKDRSICSSEGSMLQ